MTVGEEESIGPGSLWLRWDPHVHAPGTIFNDQFKGDWEAYLAAIEGATPAIRALGITDYYGLDVIDYLGFKSHEHGYDYNRNLSDIIPYLQAAIDSCQASSHLRMILEKTPCK